MKEKTKKAQEGYGINDEDIQLITQYLKKPPYERSAEDLMKIKD